VLHIFCKASTEILLHFLLFRQAKLPASEIAATIDAFRTHHLAELTEVHITFIFFSYIVSQVLSLCSGPFVVFFNSV
jgi:hypothetical protein